MNLCRPTWPQQAFLHGQPCFIYTLGLIVSWKVFIMWVDIAEGKKSPSVAFETMLLKKRNKKEPCRSPFFWQWWLQPCPVKMINTISLWELE